MLHWKLWIAIAGTALIAGGVAWFLKLWVIVATDGRVAYTGAAATFLDLGLGLLLVGFSNPKGTDEGKKFIGQKKVSTDASGNVSFTKALPRVGVGKTITATATGPGGNTSEFSAPKKVVAS